jgi:hypothetical protein
MADLLVKRPVSPDRLSLNGQETAEQVNKFSLPPTIYPAKIDRFKDRKARAEKSWLEASFSITLQHQ